MIKGNLYVRTRRDGDRFRPAGRGVTKSLKKLLNEMKLDVMSRDSLLLLCDDDGIVFIEGVGCCERVMPTGKTKNLCEVEIKTMTD